MGCEEQLFELTLSDVEGTMVLPPMEVSVDASVAVTIERVRVLLAERAQAGDVRAARLSHGPLHLALELDSGTGRSAQLGSDALWSDHVGCGGGARVTVRLDTARANDDACSMESATEGAPDDGLCETLAALVEKHPEATTWVYVVHSSACTQQQQQQYLQAALERGDGDQWAFKCLAHAAVSVPGGCSGGMFRRAFANVPAFLESHGVHGDRWPDVVRICTTTDAAHGTLWDALPTVAQRCRHDRVVAVTKARGDGSDTIIKHDNGSDGAICKDASDDRPPREQQLSTTRRAGAKRKHMEDEQRGSRREDRKRHCRHVDVGHVPVDIMSFVHDECGALLSLPLQRWQPEHTPEVSIGQYKATRAAFFVRRALRIQAWLRDEAVELRAQLCPPDSPRFSSVQQYMAHVRMLPVDMMVERMDALAADSDTVTFEDLPMFVDVHVFLRELVPLRSFAAV